MVVRLARGTESEQAMYRVGQLSTSQVVKQGHEIVHRSALQCLSLRRRPAHSVSQPLRRFTKRHVDGRRRVSQRHRLLQLRVSDMIRERVVAQV